MKKRFPGIRSGLFKRGIRLSLQAKIALLTTLVLSAVEVILFSTASQFPLSDFNSYGLFPWDLAFMAVLGGVGAYLVARHTLTPLQRMAKSARQIHAGTLDIRLPSDSPDEDLNNLAAAINTVLDRLEAAFAQQQDAFERQSRFVADAAHELRTPLATMRTNLEVAQLDDDIAQEDYLEMTRTLERTLIRLEKLVADLLVLATENQVMTRQVSIGPILEEALSDLAPLAAEYGVSLRYGGDSGAVVDGDDQLLIRAFTNLVENGIRYNQPGGEVSAAISHNEHWAILTVADTGVGIPPHAQARIFNRFYRVDSSRARHTGGAGLGLSIVARILQWHHGTIQVASVPGQGSAFIVKIPLSESPEFDF